MKSQVACGIESEQKSRLTACRQSGELLSLSLSLLVSHYNSGCRVHVQSTDCNRHLGALKKSPVSTASCAESNPERSRPDAQVKIIPNICPHQACQPNKQNRVPKVRKRNT